MLQSDTSAFRERRNPSACMGSWCSTKSQVRHQGCDRSCGSPNRTLGSLQECGSADAEIDLSTVGTAAHCASAASSLCNPVHLHDFHNFRCTRPVLVCRTPSVSPSPSCNTRCLALHRGCGKSCAHQSRECQDHTRDNSQVCDCVRAGIDESTFGTICWKSCGPGSHGTHPLKRECPPDARRKREC